MFSDVTDHETMRHTRGPSKHTPHQERTRTDDPDPPPPPRHPPIDEYESEVDDDRPHMTAPRNPAAPPSKSSSPERAFPPTPLDQLNRDAFAGPDQHRIDALYADLDFVEAANRRDQIAVACKHLREFEGASRFTFDAIGQLFRLRGAQIEAQWKRSKQQVREVGRPPLLPLEAQAWMRDLIVQRFEEHNPITYAELLDTLQYAHNVILSGDSLRHIVRGMPTVKSVIGVPTESERVAVQPEHIEAWFERLEQSVAGVPRAFIFNV
jgi:hypothetical protein